MKEQHNNKLTLKLMMGKLAEHRADYQSLCRRKDGSPPAGIFEKLPPYIIEADPAFLELREKYQKFVRTTTIIEPKEIENLIKKIDEFSYKYCFSGYRERLELTAALGIIQEGEWRKTSLVDELNRKKGRDFFKISLLLSFKSFVLLTLKNSLSLIEKLQKDSIISKIEKDKLIYLPRPTSEEHLLKMREHIQERLEKIENITQWPDYDDRSAKLHHQLKIILDDVSKAIFYNQVSEESLQILDKKYYETCPISEQEINDCYKNTFYAGIKELQEWSVSLKLQLIKNRAENKHKSLDKFYDVLDENLSQAEMNLSKNFYDVSEVEKQLAFIDDCLKLKDTYEMYANALLETNKIIIKAKENIQKLSGNSVIAVWGKEFFESSLSEERDEYELCPDYFSLSALKNDIENTLLNPDPSRDNVKINPTKDRKNEIAKQIDCLAIVNNKALESKEKELIQQRERLAKDKQNLAKKEEKVSHAEKEKMELPVLIEAEEKKIKILKEQLETIKEEQPVPAFDKYTGEKKKARWLSEKEKKIKDKELEIEDVVDVIDNMRKAVVECEKIVSEGKKTEGIKQKIEQEEKKIEVELSLLKEKKVKYEVKENFDDDKWGLESHILMAKKDELISYFDSFLRRQELKKELETQERKHQEIESEIDRIKDALKAVDYDPDNYVINRPSYERILITSKSDFDKPSLYREKFDQIRSSFNEIKNLNNLYFKYPYLKDEKNIFLNPSAYQLTLIHEALNRNISIGSDHYFDGLSNDLLASSSDFNNLLESYRNWNAGTLSDQELLKIYKSKFILYVLDNGYCVKPALKSGLPFDKISKIDMLYHENGMTKFNQELCLSFSKEMHRILKQESGISNREIKWFSKFKFDLTSKEIDSAIKKTAEERLKRQKTRRFLFNMKGYNEYIHNRLLSIEKVQGENEVDELLERVNTSMPLEIEESYREVLLEKDKDIGERKNKLKERLENKINILFDLVKIPSGYERDEFVKLLKRFRNSLEILLKKENNYDQVRKCVDNLDLYFQMFYDVYFDKLGHQKKWQPDFSVENIKKRMEDISISPDFEKDRDLDKTIREMYGAKEKDIILINFEDSIRLLIFQLERLTFFREDGYVFEQKMALERRLNLLLHSKRTSAKETELTPIMTVGKKAYVESHFSTEEKKVKNKYFWRLLELLDKIYMSYQQCEMLYEKIKLKKSVQDVQYFKSCNLKWKELFENVKEISRNVDSITKELFNSYYEEYCYLCIISDPAELEINQEFRKIQDFIDELRNNLELTDDGECQSAIDDLKKKIERIKKINEPPFYVDENTLENFKKSCSDLFERLRNKPLINKDQYSFQNIVKSIYDLMQSCMAVQGDLYHSVNSSKEEKSKPIVLSDEGYKLVTEKGFLSHWGRLPKRLPGGSKPTVSTDPETIYKL